MEQKSTTARTRAQSPALLVCGSLGLGRVDFDAALEMGAIFDADTRSGNVTNDRAIRFNIHAVARVEIADDFAEYDYFAGMNFGIELGGRAHGQVMAAQ